MKKRSLHRLGIGGLVAVAAAGLAVPASSADGQTAAAGPSSGRDDLSGQEAIRTLGSGLGRAAARVGWSEQRLRAELAEDTSLRMTAEGSLYYVEYPDAAHSTAATPSATVLATAPLDATFTLHSKPGALRTIYIDANGHDTAGTEWNSTCVGSICNTRTIASAPFDVNGNSSSFSSTELTLIQGIWARVADDFAMFDVDVTTEEPPSSDLVRTSLADQRFGQRVVLTRSNFLNPALGVAFIGSFGDRVDTPAFVFSRIGGSAYTVVHALAQGVSHEVGHTLGLSHDGSGSSVYTFGTAAWGPIMGGAGKAVYVTWSKGEYAGANNTEDDLDVMGLFGMLPVPDDTGDSPAAATVLPLAGGRFATTGTISTQNDLDVLAVDGAGLLEVSVTPTAPFEPNLDARLRVLDEGGQVVATSDPVGRGAPSLQIPIGPGRYYLEVDGVGFGNALFPGNYSDYASLGHYQLSGRTGSADPLVGVWPSASGTSAPSGASLGVAFSSAGSSDPEGQPLAFVWDFGDGSQSTDAAPVHTYPGPGTYTAVLTVTDVGGLDASATLQVTVADPATQLRIAAIDGVRVRRSLAKVTVKIVDGYGNPVRSASVKGRWLGSTTTRTAYTNSQGIASFSRATSKPTEFTTTKVSRSRRTWDGVNASAAVPAL